MSLLSPMASPSLVAWWSMSCRNLSQAVKQSLLIGTIVALTMSLIKCTQEISLSATRNHRGLQPQ